MARLRLPRGTRNASAIARANSDAPLFTADPRERSMPGFITVPNGLVMRLEPAPLDDNAPATVPIRVPHSVHARHAARDLPISRLLLELQADVDRFVFSRLNALRSHREALTHFERFRWADGLDEAVRDRYELAHDRAHHYCRRLNDRFPRRADLPGLVSELRRFYRASPESKLRAA